MHGMIAVHPTGSGKTALALAVARCYLSQNPANSVILCTSKTLINNYWKEMDKMGIDINDRSRYRVFSIDTFYRGYIKYNNSVNIEGVDDIGGEIDSDDSDIEIEGAFSTKSALFIIDEAHNLKTERGKRATVFIKAAEEADKVLLTTATPLVNYISDAANLISMVSKMPPFTRKQFEEVMLNPSDAKRVVGGYFDFYDLEPQDLKEYPDVEFENVFMRMPDALYEHYKAQELYLEGRSEKDITNDFFNENLSAFYTGVRLAANINPAEMEGSMAKASWIKEFVRGNPLKKVLIFSQYVKYGCELVRSEISDLGVETGIVYGKCSSKQRDETIDRYNKGIIQILIISNCGKEGLDLKNTDAVIIYENGWNKVTEDQVVGRAVRRGSHITGGKVNPIVSVYRLLMVKPSEFDSNPVRSLAMAGKKNANGELKSIDLLLMSLSMEKARILEDSFNTIKIFNKEVAREQEELYKEGLNISTNLNKLILGILKRKPFVSSRIESEGIGNPVLSSVSKVTMEIALVRISSLPTPVIIDLDHFRGRYNAESKSYEIYFVSTISSPKEFIDLQAILEHLGGLILSTPIQSSHILNFVTKIRKVGPLIKDKIYFAKLIARLNMLTNGKVIYICMLFDLFNCVVFTRWNPIKVGMESEVRIRSSFDDLKATEKSIHVWNGSNIISVLGEPSEILPGGILMGTLRDDQVIEAN